MKKAEGKCLTRPEHCYHHAPINTNEGNVHQEFNVLLASEETFSNAKETTENIN